MFSRPPVLELARWQGSLAEAWACLVPGERVRAERFRADTARDQFVRDRAAVRGLLGEALACPPQDVALKRDAHGRPVLEHEAGASVSWSRSGGAVLVGLSWGGAIGVDLEAVRLIDAPGILKMICGPQERAERSGFGGAAFEAAALRTWTVKEAVLKAAGLGFRGGVKDLIVPDALLFDGVGQAELPHRGRRYLVANGTAEGFELAVALERPA